jgi:hypothetical protein
VHAARPVQDDGLAVSLADFSVQLECLTQAGGGGRAPAGLALGDAQGYERGRLT